MYMSVAFSESRDSRCSYKNEGDAVATVCIFLLHPRRRDVVRYLLKPKRFYISNLLDSPGAWEANIFTYYQGESGEPSTIRRGKETYDAPNDRRMHVSTRSHLSEVKNESYTYLVAGGCCDIPGSTLP